MKMRKFTAFIIAVVALVATINFIPVSAVKAAPAITNSDVEFVQGYDSYKNEYIAKKFLSEEDLKNKNDFYFTFKEFDGTNLPAFDYEGSVVALKDNGSTMFKVIPGNYVITFYKKGDNNTRTDEKFYSFKVVIDTTDNSISYKTFVKANAENDNKEYKDYLKKMSEDVADNKLGDYFYYPVLDSLVTSNHFSYDALDKILYYAKPDSESFTKTSSRSFQLSEVGTYSYYVLAKNPLNNGMSYDFSEKDDKGNDKYVRDVLCERGVLNADLGIDAWYEVSETERKFICPIFTFDFNNIKNPEIEISAKSEDGYKGLKYKDVKNLITIKAEKETVKYTLYFSTEDLKVKSELNKEWASKGVNYIENLAKDNKEMNVTENEEIGFNTSTLQFTPNKKGYYYVICRVADEFGGEGSAVINPVFVHEEFEEVSYEKEFLKYNWVSIVFLSIAAVSFIGIIVLFFVKPKEKKEDEDVQNITKK